MINAEGLERTLAYFVTAPAGEPDAILGSVAALIAQEACNSDKCSVSATRSSYDGNLESDQTKRRQLGCDACLNEVCLTNSARTPRSPDIVEVEEHRAYMRPRALTALNEFWEVVDSVSIPNQIFDPQVRQTIAGAIDARYVEASSDTKGRLCK